MNIILSLLLVALGFALGLSFAVLIGIHSGLIHISISWRRKAGGEMTSERMDQ